MIFYTNHMVTTKQKSREETQSIKKEETEKKNHRNHQTKMWDRNTREKKLEIWNKQQKNKMVIVNPHISVITLNVNGMNPPIKICKGENKTQLCAVYRGLISVLKTNTGSK